MTVRAQPTIDRGLSPGGAVHAASGSPCGLRRILVVDDEAHVLRVVRLSLERNGYEVDTALNGEVALRMLHEEQYPVVIVSAEFAVGHHGLCDCVSQQFSEQRPLIMVMVDDEDVSDIDLPTDGVEWIERPVSLRWIVSRLNEYFGAYDRL